MPWQIVEQRTEKTWALGTGAAISALTAYTQTVTSEISCYLAEATIILGSLILSDTTPFPLMTS